MGSAHSRESAATTLTIVTECPICTCENVAGVRLGCEKSDHVLCFPCALRTVRGELGPRSTQVRCPLCLAATPAEVASLPTTTIAAVVTWSRRPRVTPAMTSDLRPVSEEESARFFQKHATSRVDPPPMHSVPVDPSLPQGLFKRCPQCGTGVIRARGHHCHHISPAKGSERGGCLNCG